MPEPPQAPAVGAPAQHATTATVSTHPAPPPPAQHAPRPARTSWSAAALGVFATLAGVLALAVLAMVASRAGVLGGGGGGRRSVLHAMVSVMPTQMCIPLTPEQIVARRFNMGTTRIDLNEVRDSLLYHMEDRNMSVVCGQYLQFNKVCYCIMDVAPPGARRRDLMHMFNLDVLGGSSELVRNVEEVPFCAEPHSRTRFRSVVYAYDDEAGVRFHARADDTVAQLVQMANDVQLGQAICVDTNLEAMLQHIRRDIYELRAGDTRSLDFVTPARHAKHPSHQHARLPAPDEPPH